MFRVVFCVVAACAVLGCTHSPPGIPDAALGYAPTEKHPLLGTFELQTEKVAANCFTPELKLILAEIAERFDAVPVVTSGFRDPRTSRERAGKGSYHTRCMAADVQVPGVAPAKVFAEVKAMDERGGIGLYCHTKSVHVDVGPEREWRWPCRR